MPRHYLNQCWDTLILTLGTNFREIWSEIHLKMSSAKWRQLCLHLNVLSIREREYTQIWLYVIWLLIHTRASSFNRGLTKPPPKLNMSEYSYLTEITGCDYLNLFTHVMISYRSVVSFWGAALKIFFSGFTTQLDWHLDHESFTAVIQKHSI